MASQRARVIAVVTVIAIAFTAARAADEKSKKDPGGKQAEPRGEATSAAAADLTAWGTIKEVKDADRFFTLDYTKLEGQKARKLSAFVKIPEDVELFRDRLLRVTDLKEGDGVWILGRPMEIETQTPQGVTGIDRQMQNVQAIVLGDGLRVHRAYRDPRDPKVKWCEAKVTKAGPAIAVEHEGSTFGRVTMAKGVQIMVREKSPDARGLKSGAMVEVEGAKSDERPETKSAADGKKPAFVVKKAVILDRRLAGTVYPALVP